MTFKQQLDELGIAPSAIARWSGIRRETVLSWYHGAPIPEPLRPVLNLDPEQVRETVAHVERTLGRETVRGVVKRRVEGARIHRAPRSGRPVTPHSLEKLLHESVRRMARAKASR